MNKLIIGVVLLCFALGILVTASCQKYLGSQGVTWEPTSIQIYNNTYQAPTDPLGFCEAPRNCNTLDEAEI